jgi:phage major head subunit gpT-like protein
MLQVAKTALQSTVIAATTNIKIAEAEVMAVPRLGSAVFAVFQLDDDPSGKPFVYQDRKKLETNLVDNPKLPYYEYLADGRYNMGYANWHKGVRYEFTTKG